MALPSLYKYLDVHGAKLTLGNNTFRHAKPSDFNDTEELTVQSIFPEDVETALTQLSKSFTDVIVKNVNEPPTCNPEMAEKIALLQRIFRENPGAADAVREQIKKDPIYEIFDVEKMRAISAAFVEEINQFMQDYRILCVTAHKNCERMWKGYAQNHEGIALKIEPNIAKDSKFQLFLPVQYRALRPPLYGNALDFQERSLFGDQEAVKQAILDKIIYSKTLQWEYESEYRLAIPLRKGEDWNTLPYHPEEISELYLGLAMTKENKDEIVGKAQALNPNIAIFQVRRKNNGKLAFERA